MTGKARFSIWLWLWLLVAGLGGATLFSYLGRVSWVFDLFTPFRLQYAGFLAITLLLAASFRQWLPAAFALLFLIPNLIAISYYFPARTPPPAPSDLRVVSFNLLTSNLRRDEVRDFLASSDADLILVLEASRDWVEALRPLEAGYPHTVKVPRRDNFGLALYSRHPITSHELQSAEPFAISWLHAVVSRPGQEVHVIGVHPLPPMNERNWRSRNAYLASLADHINVIEDPLVVMGDFNATPWSPFFREFLDTTGLHDSGRKRGFQSTWNRPHPFFSIPIDHVLHNDRLTATQRSIGPDLGSDHRALTVEFSMGTE